MGLFTRIIGRAGFAHGGIHPAMHKSDTAEKAIRRLPFAPRLVVPLAQHRGAPAQPLVRIGQEVVRGQMIGAPTGAVSAALHAPATGRVVAIESRPSAEGPGRTAIVIEVCQAADQAVAVEEPIDVLQLPPQDIVDRVRQAGLVGLGGAAFPTHVKLLPTHEHAIHTLLVNGCECEPYLTCDHRLMLERGAALLHGIRIVLRATGAQRALLGIEDNKVDAYESLRGLLSPEDPISLHLVEARYPQGAEKLLTEALLGIQVPESGLTADLGIVVLNVGTLVQVGELLPQGQGLIERVLTVSGPGVRRPGNYLVPIGTPVSFLLRQVGAEDDVGEVILGGPMMGMTVASLEVPITKGVSGVVVYRQTDIDRASQSIYPCIKCSRCVDACPMRLNPSLLGELARSRRYAQMRDHHHLEQCFECGCCSYVCPSNIPLTQYFRIAKAINREVASRVA